jgi:cysteine desulfurase
MLMEKVIYLDNAATTPTHPEVIATMQPYFQDKFGNPATLYSLGRTARQAIEEARDQVAALMGANPNEVYFTSGGTEADNFALVGVAYANEKKGKHIITSKVEHHAVLEPAHFLEKRGFEVTYLPVDQYGMVDPEDVRKAIRKDTVLISIMFANNEVGTIMPVAEIGRIAKEKEVYFHTDAVQAYGHIPVNVDEINCDLLSLSGHKLSGPKGVGAIYIRKGTRIAQLLRGGSQENNRRAGTHNVPGIVGLGKAAEIASRELETEARRLTELRNYLIKGILDNIEDVRLNGHPTKRLPNNVSVCIEGAEGESVLLSLDMEGICASSGSACTSGTLEPSHVLLAMGIPAEIAHGSLRMTLGRMTTKEDIDFVLEVLPPLVKRLRAMSPLSKKL